MNDWRSDGASASTAGATLYRWAITGVGVAFLGAVLVATLLNTAPLRYALLQASLPALVALAFVYVGVRYRHRYRPAELATIARWTLVGIAVLIVLAGWIRLNITLTPTNRISPAIALVTASLAGAAGGTAIGQVTVDRRRRIRDHRSASRQLQGVMDTVDAAIFIKDLEGRYQLMNDACRALFGIDADEDITGLQDRDVFSADQVEAFRDVDQTVVENDETVRTQQEIDTADGHETHIVSKSPLYDETGAPIGICGVSTDITDRVERERELLARSTAMATSIEGMAILDENEEYVYVNEAHAEIYGYDDPDAFIGETWRMCYTDDAVSTFEAEIVPTLFEEGSWRGEATGLREDGSTFPQELSLTTLEDGGMVCVLRDISERKRRQEALERQNERLERFTSMVSHDLRNPLNVAQGRLNLAMEATDDENLAAVDRALDRMDALIDDLLALGRSGHSVGDREAVSLADVCTRCWESVKTSDATLTNQADTKVLADRSRLKQLVENLYRNAIDHAGEDVTVTIGTLEDGFYIEDDGPGIPPDERDTIFEWGYTTDGEGTGYGLAIVADIVDAHDWEITVTDGDAGGARFEIKGVDTPVA